MKTWKRATQRIPCGVESGCIIQEGDPYLLLIGPEWRKVRCARHTEQAVPADIDEVKQQPVKPLKVPEFTALKGLAERFDARKKAAHDE